MRRLMRMAAFGVAIGVVTVGTGIGEAAGPEHADVTRTAWPGGAGVEGLVREKGEIDVAQAVTAAKDVAYPDTIAGRRYAEWVDAFNSDSLERLRAVHASVSPPEMVDRRAEMDLIMRAREGAFTVAHVEADGEFHVRALVYTGLTELWMEMIAELESEPPHFLAGLGLRPAAPPPGTEALSPLSSAELQAELARYFDKLVQADAFSGSVLVAKDGVPLFAQAYGMADRERGIPNQLDTKYNLGSMNKMITAVAVAQLAEAGLIDLYAPINRYLPDYPGPGADVITPHHLLTHTSGLGDFFTPEFFAGAINTARSPRDYFPLFTNRPLHFAPGAEWRYSNAGFIVLGAIIEAVSGEDYFDYVRAHIYAPSGMPDTDAYERDADVPNLAIGYLRPTSDGGPMGAGRPAVDQDDGWVRNTDTLPLKGSPAGGGYSTVLDLLAFDQALRGHRLLSPEFTDLVLTDKVNAIDQERYGYGFQTDIGDSGRIVGHSGGAPGINGNLDMYLDRGYTVVVLVNYDFAASSTSMWLRNALARVVE